MRIGLCAMMGIAVLIVGYFGWREWSKAAIGEAILAGRSVSFDDDSRTTAMLNRIAPTALANHRRAFAECMAAGGRNVVVLPADNERLVSWNALLLIFKATNNSGVKAYIFQHLVSGNAFEDEQGNAEKAFVAKSLPN